MSSLFFSCAGLPAARPEAPAIAENPPERPEIPPTPDHILGQGLIPRDKLALFLEKTNPEAEKDFVENLCAYYMEEGAAEGVNHDIAFAQMCLETGFLRYGGLVTPDMNNFCGLGAIGPGQNGERFGEPRIGVRAHIQHLKAYATDEPLKQELVDPRYRWVRYGSAPTIKGLAGTWASDRAYAEKIAAILDRLYQFAYGETGTQVAQVNSAL
ncbi:lipoprotein [Spirochaetia bacterium]|nr:lipoprotein [Spirochaetia bacterium]